MKQTKLVFLDENKEIHNDYMHMMSKYKHEVEKYKAKLNNEVK